MSRLDVLFVIPSGRAKGAYGPVAKDAIEPPAKARFMAAYLMRRGVSLDLIDANVTDDAPDQMAEKVLAADPHLVVVPVFGFNPSSSTQTMPAARVFAEAIRDVLPDTPIMFTGTHPAAIPETTLLTEPAVTAVCGGEGPITVHEFLQAIKGGHGTENVRSLWYWKDGGIVHNEPAPLIDLNEEPALPGWKYMDPRNYRAHHWHTFYRDFDDRGPYANPYSREGCPFHCGFCNIQGPYREGEENLVQLGLLKPGANSFRTLRPELFLEELEYLATLGVRYIKIPDEMFGFGEHPVRIAEGIRDRFGDWFNIWPYFRIDTCNPSKLELFRSAGIRWVALGIEAANSKVRSGQDKKFNEETIHKVVERVRAAGIEGGLNYIFGLSEYGEDGVKLKSFDTMETMQATYDLAAELNSTYANFYCDQALPGSDQYRHAKANGYPLPERPGGPGWIGHSQYGYDTEPFYPGDALTPAKILRFADAARVAYYKRPEYRARLLGDPKFGEVALRNIDAWVAKLGPDQLKRRLLEEEAARR